MKRQVINLRDRITDGTATIAHDEYDAGLWAFLREHNEVINNQLQTLGMDYVLVGDLARDLFWELWKANPKPLDDVAMSHLLNARLTKGLLNAREFQAMRTSTQGDIPSAVLATCAVSGYLVRALSEKARRGAARASALKEQIEREYAKADSLNHLTQVAPTPEQKQQLEAMAQQAENNADTAMTELETIADMLENGDIDIDAGTFAGAIAETMQEIDEIQQGIDALMGGVGGVGDGTETNEGDIKTRLFLAYQLGNSQQLRDIAAMLGNLRMLAVKKQRVRTDMPVETISIQMGNHPERLLTSELALLSDSDTEDAFYVRFSEGKTLERELQYHETETKGPIICVVDTSGSMAGNKDTWAKAVELCLLKIAKREKRAFRSIHFASDNQIRVRDFDTKRPQVDEMVATALQFYNGGTDYNQWINKALESIEESEYNRADVVCISDGAPHHPPKTYQWFQTKKERSFSAIGIYVSDFAKETIPPVFANLFDRAYDLHDLTGTDAKQALESVFSL